MTLDCDVVPAPPLALAVDALDCGVVVIGADRRIAHWNRWMADRAGVPAGAAVGRRLTDVFPALADTRLDVAVCEVLATGMPTVLSHHLNRTLFPLMRPDESGWASLLQAVVLKPVPTADGGIACVIQINDVTLATRKERMLRHAREAKYKAIFDNIDDAILTLDAFGRIVVANQGTAVLFGYTRGELVGSEAVRLLPGLDIAAMPAAGYVDLTGRHRNGTELCLEASLSGWRDFDRVFHTLALRDVSTQRRNERLLAEARDRAQESDHRKSAFIAGLGRVLRTPLNIIAGFSQLLTEARTELSDETAAEYLDTIGRSAHGLLGSVDNILDYARIEAGQDDLSLEVLNLAREVEAAVAAVEAQADQAEVAVVASFDRRSATVLADRKAFRRILGNVLANAVAASPAGGTVTVRAQTTTGPCIVTVADTGAGIDPEDLDRVLLPFERGAEEVGGRGGVGLGLPIAKALIEAHGGRLVLRSRPGIGTEVSLEYPPLEQHRRSDPAM